MITVKQVLVNPEVMIKHKDNLKNIQIFLPPWYGVFRQYPYLYREFSDRFDEMDWLDIACALRDDPTLISDLKNHLCNLDGWGVFHAVRCDPTLTLIFKYYLHKMGGLASEWLEDHCPELSLCIKHKDDPDKVEAAYYVLFPHKLDDLNNEEKREAGKKIIELLREEKI